MGTKNHNMCRAAGDILGERCRVQQERIEQLETENKKMKEMKCPPILSGDSCICPIEELETMLINRDERIKEFEAENTAEVRHPTDSDGKINKSMSYCYHCGAHVRDQKYCKNCGWKLLWPIEQALKGGE